MDADPSQLRSLGLAGIFRETFRIIFSWKRLFFQITIVVVIPLCLLYLMHSFVKVILGARIDGDLRTFHSISSGNPMAQRLDERIVSNALRLMFFNLAFLVFMVFFGVVATSAVTYSVACAYASTDTSFFKVIKVVPNVWKRMAITMACSLVMIIGFHAAAAAAEKGSRRMFDRTIRHDATVKALVWTGYLAILAIIVGGSAMVNLISHFANVVAVMEEAYGFPAIRRSGQLLQGRLWLAFWVYMAFYVPFLAMGSAMERLVVDDAANMGLKAACAVVFMLLMSPPILVGLTAAAVGYLVAKAFHNEGMDKARLAELLELYLSYRPLSSQVLKSQP